MFTCHSALLFPPFSFCCSVVLPICTVCCYLSLPICSSVAFHLFLAFSSSSLYSQLFQSVPLHLAVLFSLLFFWLSSIYTIFFSILPLYSRMFCFPICSLCCSSLLLVDVPFPALYTLLAVVSPSLGFSFCLPLLFNTPSSVFSFGPVLFWYSFSLLRRRAPHLARYLRTRYSSCSFYLPLSCVLAVPCDATLPRACSLNLILSYCIVYCVHQSRFIINVILFINRETFNLHIITYVF